MKPSVMFFVRWAAVSACFLLGAIPSASFGSPWKAAPMDWPYWRGPEMNNISREKNIVDSWSPRGENLLWKREDIGGRSTPIVMNGKLYTICRDDPGTETEAEKCVCVDAATGETLWESRWNAYLTDVPDTRLGWSSAVGDPDTGNVYTLGVCGYFQCLDGNTGETLWSHSMSEEYGLLSTYGGRTNFPIVFEDLVIVSGVIIGWGDMAKPNHRFIAFDKRTGQVVWFEGTRPLPEDTTYSSPTLAVINGQAQLIFAAGDGAVYGLQPRTGKRIWSYNVSLRGINTSPAVSGNIVVCGHSEENLDTNKMGALFAVDASKTGDITKSGELWRIPEVSVGRGAPIIVDGRVYVVEETGKLTVADLQTGKIITSVKLRGTRPASPLFADGKLYVSTESGVWWTFRPTEDGLEEVHRARLSIGEVIAAPIVSHGRMYVTTSDAIYCIGKEGQEPAADPRPEFPAEEPVQNDQEPALVQLAPVEALLRPGQKQQFQVRLYNQRGQYLKLADPGEVKFSLDGPGEMDPTGKFSKRDDADKHTATIVTAEVGKLKGTARIRVVPKLPWSFDFSEGEVPITWVGIRYRHVPIDFALLKALQERDPLAGQLYIYLTTDFVNSGQREQVYDDSTPRMRWTELLRFVNLLDNAAVLQSVDQAKAVLDPALTELKSEGLVESWSWSEWQRGESASGPQLTVRQGSRGIDPENGVMMKITTIPKGTRSQGWMGHPSFHDYTIQADVYAEKNTGATPAITADSQASETLPNSAAVDAAPTKGRLPDMGIIGQRYTLDMKGSHQELQIRTWPPQERMAKSIPFEWEANVWYTMKLRASVEDGKAVLRGKVWRRDEPEPEEWMLEAVDPSPNLVGSPGLYADAKNAEVIYDNIKVYEN